MQQQTGPCAEAEPHGSATEGWQAQFLGRLARRKRLSVLVPVLGVVMTTPHSWPFC